MQLGLADLRGQDIFLTKLSFAQQSSTLTIDFCNRHFASSCCILHSFLVHIPMFNMPLFLCHIPIIGTFKDSRWHLGGLVVGSFSFLMVFSLLILKT